MELLELNKLSYFEQMEVLEFGEIIPKIKDYPIQDSIVIDYEKGNWVQNVWGKETELNIYLSVQEAKELIKKNPNKVFNFKKIGNMLISYEKDYDYFNKFNITTNE